MINFFRKIRQQLLTENKFIKYLLYAIGEILLVVIGILIALQINNWNERNKERIKEREILIDLVENLELNVKTLEGRLNGSNRDKRSSKIVISAIENKSKDIDSLEFHFAYGLNQSSEGSVLSFVGYKSMQNAGFEIIRNDQLKKEIISLFELTYINLQRRNDRIGQTYAEVRKLVHGRLLRKPGFRFTPFDFDKLVDDKEFLSWLYTINDNRSWMAASIDESLQETLRVLELLRDELKESD